MENTKSDLNNVHPKPNVFLRTYSRTESFLANKPMLFQLLVLLIGSVLVVIVPDLRKEFESFMRTNWQIRGYFLISIIIGASFAPYLIPFIFRRRRTRKRIIRELEALEMRFAPE